MVHSRYSEYKILVDGKTVVDGGAKVILGIMPNGDDAVFEVKKALAG